MKSRHTALLSTLLRLRVLIPVLLTAALLLFAFSITDLPKVMTGIRSLSLSTLVAAFGLAALYLLVKGVEFGWFLRALGLSIAWRPLILAYAIGELCITIPSGIYVQNYVLNRIHAAPFPRSAAATTAMLVIEGTLILVSLVILVIPGWPWLRLLILSAFALAAILMTVLRKLHLISLFRIPSRPRHRAHRLFLALLNMMSALRDLLVPGVLIPAVLLTSAYLLVLLAAFLTIAHGVGVPALTFVQATTIYFFSLSVMLTLGGFLTQVGIIEVAGLGASHAWGYSLDEGLAMLLGFRIVWTMAMWLLNGVVLIALRRELRQPAAAHHLEEPTH